MYLTTSQQKSTSWNSTIEASEKGVKYVQNSQQKQQNPFSSVSVVDFEQVNAYCVRVSSFSWYPIPLFCSSQVVCF